MGRALAALAFMVFVLLYTPCMVATAAARQEFGSCGNNTGCPFAGTTPRTFALVTDSLPALPASGGSCGCRKE